jgi:hypothetical protein
MKNSSDFFIGVTSIRATSRTQKVKWTLSIRAKGFWLAAPTCGTSHRLIRSHFGGIPDSPEISRRC